MLQDTYTTIKKVSKIGKPIPKKKKSRPKRKGKPRLERSNRRRRSSIPTSVLQQPSRIRIPTNNTSNVHKHNLSYPSLPNQHTTQIQNRNPRRGESLMGKNPIRKYLLESIRETRKQIEKKPSPYLKGRLDALEWLYSIISWIGD